MAGNELGCVRISMMARSISSNTRPDTLVRDHRLQSHAFPLQRTAGPYIGVKRFQTIHDGGVGVAHGLVLLSGIGTWALPSWDSKTRWNDLLGGLVVGRSKQTHELTSSIVPRGTPFHRVVELGFPSTSFDLVGCSRGCSAPGPAEFGAVNPDAVHDHRQSAGQRDNGSFHAAAPLRSCPSHPQCRRSCP